MISNYLLFFHALHLSLLFMIFFSWHSFPQRHWCEKQHAFVDHSPMLLSCFSEVTRRVDDLLALKQPLGLLSGCYWIIAFSFRQPGSSDAEQIIWHVTAACQVHEKAWVGDNKCNFTQPEKEPSKKQKKPPLCPIENLGTLYLTWSNFISTESILSF